MGRNITVTLDEDTLQAARVAAARRGTSVSGLLRDEIRRLAHEDRAYEAARRAALARLKAPGKLEIPAALDRDRLHERGDIR